MQAVPGVGLPTTAAGVIKSLLSSAQILLRLIESKITIIDHYPVLRSTALEALCSSVLGISPLIHLMQLHNINRANSISQPILQVRK